MRTNALKVTSYQGRNNAVRMSLIINDVLVPENIVTRVVVKLEGISGSPLYCLDTQLADGLIELIENRTVLRFFPGLIPDVALGDYWGWISVFDALAPEGLAWGASADKRGTFNDEPALYLKMARWPVCS